MNQPAGQFASNQNINDLPYNIKRKVCEVLDLQSGWRQLIQACEEITDFQANDIKVEQFAAQLHRGRSASEQVWNWLGDRGMTFKQLVQYLEKAKLERALGPLKSPEPLRIILEPQPNVTVNRGDAFTISCEAKGFPFPRYHWFKDQELIKKSTVGQLVIKHAKNKHNGVFTCRVHNEESLKTKHCLFSRPCHVMVTPARFDDSDSDDWDSDEDGTPVGKIPAFTVQPQDQVVKFGAEVCLRCKATPNKRVQYQWWKDDQKLPGAIKYKLKIAAAGLADAGRYWCTVYNGVHPEIRSQEALLKVAENRRDGIHIMNHPKAHMTCYEEDKVELSVIADGPGDLVYQWFKEGQSTSVGSGPTLVIRKLRQVHAGKYHCYIEPREKTLCGAVTSRHCQLSVLQALHHRPVDKVALVIGNTEYLNEHSLPAVQWDVQEISRDLEKLGFRVLSLLNLRKYETGWIVRSFKDLFVKEGVYVVVYIAGHGFLHNGDHYLLPWDAPREAYEAPYYCVNIYDDIQKVLQSGSAPSVLCMILDICRQEEGSLADRLRHQRFPDVVAYKPRHPPENITGNLVTIFPSSRSQRVYEPRLDGVHASGTKRHGIFYQYFRKILHRSNIADLSIEAMFKELQHEFERYTEVQGQQYPMHPELSTNLTGHHCLGDPINDSNPAERDQILRNWQEYCAGIPAPSSLSLPQDEVFLHVSFTPLLGNQLVVHVEFLGLVEPICELVNPPVLKISTERSPSVPNNTNFVIRDLQRIRTPLNLQVQTTASTNQNDPVKFVFGIKLDRPLMAGLAEYAVLHEHMVEDQDRDPPIVDYAAANRVGVENEEPMSLEEDVK